MKARPVADAPPVSHGAMTTESIQQELAQAADPEKAAFFPRFFKTGPGEYAEGDRFLGVTVPHQRRIARSHRDMPLPELAKLVDSPIHEHRLTGFLILTEQFRKADEATRARLFSFCRKHLSQVNNWDIVDLVAPKLIGEHLISHPELRETAVHVRGCHLGVEAAHRHHLHAGLHPARRLRGHAVARGATAPGSA